MYGPTPGQLGTVVDPDYEDLVAGRRSMLQSGPARAVWACDSNSPCGRRMVGHRVHLGHVRCIAVRSSGDLRHRPVAYHGVEPAEALRVPRLLEPTPVRWSRAGTSSARCRSHPIGSCTARRARPAGRRARSRTTWADRTFTPDVIVQAWRSWTSATPGARGCGPGRRRGRRPSGSASSRTSTASRSRPHVRGMMSNADQDRGDSVGWSPAGQRR